MEIEKKIKYVYFGNIPFGGGTIFVTQIADWLKIYKENQVEFDYYHLFSIKKIFDIKERKDECNKIREVLPNFKSFTYFFPAKNYFTWVSTALWYKLLNKYKNYDELVIFSRALCGDEIALLKRFFPIPIRFYFDSRGAGVEERLYSLVRRNTICKKKEFKSIIGTIYYFVYKTLTTADKIFVVSNKLMEYHIETFAIPDRKFFTYPCLSDANKFYFDESLRTSVRKELLISENETVFLYSGGLLGAWQIAGSVFGFFSHILEVKRNVKFILLTKDTDVADSQLEKFPRLNEKLIYKSVDNNEIVKYLNASDFGLLLRSENVVNKVASPTKFAEYMLCGLPVIISDNVGDFSEFCLKEETGIIISAYELNEWSLFDDKKLDAKFDRKRIAKIGESHFSKQILVNDIITQFKTI